MTTADTLVGLLRGHEGAPAILAPGRAPLLHGPLRRQVRCIAAALRRAGVRRNDRVAVVLPNGPEMAVCFLGVASAATCAPLNPAYRESEFTFYFEDLQPKLLIVQKGAESPARQVAARAGVRILELEVDGTAPAGVFAFDASSAANSVGAGAVDLAETDDVALVLHTSGTTSRPKIVPLTHRNLCASAREIAAGLALTPADRCLNVMPLFHIHGLVGVLLSSLASGASVVCTEGFLAPNVLPWLEESAATWYSAVPTMHQAIVRRAEANRDIVARCRVRFVRSSSAPLPLPVLNALEQTFGVPVIEAYGMTEASHQMASNPLPPGVLKPGSVGRPTGTSVAILKPDGVVVTPGPDGTVVGEVIIKGPGLTAGYAGNPEATSEAFRDGWFRTGDLGRFDADGYLYLSGRTKEMINRGGEKISPREIDDALLAHSGVAQAVAFAMPDATLGEDVAAAVVLHEAGSVSERDLRQFVAERLADFKVPRRIVFVDEVPKGPTGKVQRIGLAQALGLGITSDAPESTAMPHREGRTPTERLLIQVWQETLGAARVGADDDFFALGGDSMLAARMLAQLGSLSGRELSLLSLFESPKLSQFAVMIDTGKGVPSAPPIRPTDRRGWFPASFGQQQMWLLDQLDHTESAYARTLLLRLPARVDHAALRSSFETLLRRHEVLRTIYRFDGVAVGQRVLEDCELPWFEERLEAADVEQAADEQRQRRFDLASDLPIRAVLLRGHAQLDHLMIVVHHIAVDGWSNALLVNELASCYEACVSGRTPALEALPIQYGDFAVWERACLDAAAMEHDLAFWRRQLADSPPLLRLPVDRMRSAIRSPRAESAFGHVTADTAAKFRAVCHREGVTLFMGLLGVFQLLLSRHSGTHDIVVGCPVARRPREAESLVGLLMNMVAVRTDLSGAPSFREVLSRVRTATLAALDHQHAPFASVVQDLRLNRSREYSPVYQVAFQLRNFPGAVRRDHPSGIQEVPLTGRVSGLDLELEAEEAHGAVNLTLVYRTDLFDRETARHLLRHFEALMCDVCSDHGQEIVEWNHTDVDFSPFVPVHELISDQARRSPDAVAVTFDDDHLTYRELEVRTNRLAQRLLARGVGSGALVGVSLERSLELVVALLGVLKAGAAYVPIDPAYPPARIAQMLRDAEPRVVLSQTRVRSRLPSTESEVLCLDERDEVDWSDGAVAPPAVVVRPGDLAYMIYTSGSTGQPKGVEVHHEALWNHMRWFGRQFSIGAADRVLQRTPASADASIWEFFAPLLAGATLVLASPGSHAEPWRLARIVQEHGITVLQVVPTILGMLLDEPLFASCRALRLQFSGGEILTRELAERFARTLPWATLVNLYGPTEVTIDATYHIVGPDHTGTTVPIGRPVDNTQGYILDDALRPVAVGTTGELFLGGAQVARGYHARPDLTAERFIPDPFRPALGARLYRTGDRCRYLPDGRIEFVGRADQQVKIRGFRTELGEIEVALRTHPAVADAVVLLRSDLPGDPRLVAYVKGAVGANELRRHVKAILPDHAVPEIFVAGDPWPLTPNGKLDRAALPRPASGPATTPLVTASDRQQLLVEWSHTAAAYPPDRLVHQLAEDWAVKTPDTLALVCADNRLTWAQLNRRANQLARILVQRGVTRGAIVALYLDRSADFVVALLAVHKAGGCYLPLDAAYPKERISFMLTDAAVSLVVTHAPTAGRLPDVRIPTVSLDREAAVIGLESEKNLDVQTAPEDLAYIIYTSGSTGQPKGVAVEHRNVINYTAAIVERLGLPQGASFALMSTVSGDLGNTAIYPALATGGTLHVIGAERASDGRALAEDWAARPVDVLKITPSHLAALLKQHRSRAILPRRCLVLGGEAARPDWIAELEALAPDCDIVNHYGPTETTVGALTFQVIADSDRLLAQSLPIGKPLGNVRAYVLDAAGKPAPIGVAGELYIGGAGVARGYLNRPELTAERFLADPFAGQPGARMYRTGDRARWLPDGNIEFLGRTDHQVKIRGYRVELGEIEAALRAHRGVLDAVVLLREDVPGEPSLVAYLVGSTISREKLRTHLARSLPDHAIPSAFVTLAAWPLTPNGKIDRRALPPPDAARQRGQAVVDAGTEAERVVAGIWEDVLTLDRVGLDDDFFELGGHSLAAMRMIARIRDAFDVDLSLQSLFASPTIRGLVPAIAKARAAAVPVAHINRRSPDQEPQVTGAQEALWFLDRMHPGLPVYNIGELIRLDGPFDAQAMTRALNEIVRRHESLRTAFPSRDGKPVAVVMPGVTLTPTFCDVSVLPEARREAALARLVGEEVRASFDLSRAPLLRVTLIRVGDEQHVVALTIHHIVSDGGSLEVLRREVRELYRAFARHEASPLAELPIQYADFAAWQTARLQGPAGARLLAYWKAALAGAPTVLELPTDKPRTAMQSCRGALEMFALPSDLLAPLAMLRQQEQATTYMTLMTAFIALVHRYTGQEDLLVGTPISLRTFSETKDLIGLLLNTLVIRARLSDALTFRSLLGQVREQVLGMTEHRELPFESLVRELVVERDLGRTPLFQVMFHMTEAEWQESEDARSGLPHTGTSKFDLTMRIADVDGGLIGVVEYSTDLFEKATVRRFIDSYVTLVRAMLTGPDQQVVRAPLLTDADRHRLLVEWNTPRSAVPAAEETLHEVFEAIVERSSDRVAVVFEGARISYGDLNRRANRLAHHLKRLGVGRETLVGLFIGRSADLVVGILGILKAGAAYVPIDPTYPTEQVVFTLNDAGVSIVLTETALAGRLGDRRGHVVCLDEPALFEGEPDANPHHDSTPDDLAYVIYTSGSTGRPKGALVTHANVVRLMHATAPWFRFTQDDVWTLFHSHAFDFSVWELWGALFYGGRVVVVPYLTSRSPHDFHRLLVNERVTVLNQTPSAFTLLMDVDAWHESRHALRYVIFGGEALDVRSLKPWFDRHGDERPRLVNMYGITETTVHVTYRPLSASDVESGNVIGVPIPDLQVYVLDRFQQPVPIGVVGEIYVGGEGVCRGYLNREALTRERFVPDAFTSRPGAVMYRSGDLARHRANGDLEFVGRADDQVKIRGFRVELGEIEVTLRSHPAVHDAIVVLREDVPGDERLVGYVTGAAVPASELSAHLKRTLPDHAVPSAFVWMEAIPVTPNGKADRRSLPAPLGGSRPAERKLVAPATEAERVLAAIWSDLLRVDRIGIHDDFFELGGHSLLVLRALSRIRDVVGVEVSPQTFFEQPTIARLAASLATATSASPIRSIARRSERDGSPLSFAQERFWLLHQLAATSSVYQLRHVVLFEGAARGDAMRQALGQLVNRHESLRTAFANREGRPVQIVLPTVDLPLQEVDLSALSLDERTRRWAELIESEGRTPFDLSRAPLFRATLAQVSPRQHALLLTIHHIVTDERSIDVLDRDLRECYDAARTGRAAALPDLPIGYVDFSCWQRDRMQGRVRQRQIDFWRDALAGAPARLDLPTDRPRPAAQTFRGATESFSLTVDLRERLKVTGRQEQATLFMTLMAAFAGLLYRYTGQTDVLVGTQISGRARSETENLIGCFLNTMVLRARFAEGDSFRSLLRHVRERALAAYGHQDLPFEQIVAEVAPRRDLSHAPIFQVMLVLNDVGSTRTPVSPDLQPAHNGTSKCDLTLAVSETDAGLDATLEYSTDLFEPETIRRLARHFANLLEAMARDVDQPIATAPMLSEADERRLLAEYRDTTVRHAHAARGVHEVIEAQAAQSPNHAAVVFGQQVLTYSSLDRRANQLARHLVSRGVGPGVLVGLSLNRSADMVVALLGILKAGGAYVPLDPALPPQRLNAMLTDSGVQVLVTRRDVALQLPAPLRIVVDLDLDAKEIDGQPIGPPAGPGASADAVAYVLYTSGSTGQPKGVEITHSALLNLLMSMQRTPGFTATDVLVAVTMLSFDIAALEVFLPLVSGGTVVVASRDDVTDPVRLMKLMDVARCTVMQATPVTWRLLVESGWRGSPSLRVLCGGEALPSKLAEQLLPRCAELWNMYGPTETTIWSTCRRITDAGHVDIGRPIDNTEVLVLDANGQLVPAGVVGELHIGGAGLARGYLNRPDLTDERFIVHPFQPDRRLYRTGDRARLLPDGAVEWLGRLDHQVKVRGFRVELGEIEAALRSHPSVTDALAVLREDAPGDQWLVAYVVGEAEPSVLRAHVSRALPDYAVPSVFVRIEAWPLTPNGKIDRRALPAPKHDRSASAARFVLPGTDTERRLAAIWARLLDVPVVGAGDDFFLLGGHSLLAMSLVHRVHQEFGVELPPGAIFEHAALADLARRIDALADPALRAPAPKVLVQIEAGGSGAPFFWVHGIGGEVLSYIDVSRHMAGARPVYGFTADWTKLAEGGALTIEAMASRCVAEIRAVRPAGPYHLGGYCSAAPLALEVARQLEAAGESVGVLAAIDYDADRRDRSPRGWRAAAAFLRNLPRWVLEDAVPSGAAELFGRLRSRMRRSGGPAGAMNGSGRDHGEAGDLRDRLGMWRFPDHLVPMLVAHLDALRRHEPKPFNGRVVLLHPRAAPLFGPWPQGHSAEWHRLALGGVDAHRVPGSHSTVLNDPFAADVAARLNVSLERNERLACRKVI